MNRAEPPAWLADLQGRFGAALRTPLDATSGTLRAQTGRYDATLVGSVQGRAHERLAVYNRQYWFRLLTVMQTSWPLTARLLGMFHFNLHAQRFLLRRPPAHYDLSFVTRDFDRFLADTLPEQAIDIGPRHAPVSKALLMEAASLDAAFERVFRAPAQPTLDPRAHAPDELAQRKLVASAAFTRFEQRWPLVELRLALRDDRAEHAVPAPAQLTTPATWALFRTPQGTAQLALDPLQARLFALLEACPLGDALAQLEAEADPSARPQLPQRTRRWIAQGVAHGFWIGLAD